MNVHTLRAADLPSPDRAVADEIAPPTLSATVVELPMPPSTNRLFKNGGKSRAESPAYRDWKGHAGWRLREQRPRYVPGPVIIVLSIERISEAADIDNRVKAIFDLLVEHKVMDDDKHVVGFCIAWAPSASGLARVMILPADNYTFDFHLANSRRAGGWFLAPQQETD